MPRRNPKRGQPGNTGQFAKDTRGKTVVPEPSTVSSQKKEGEVSAGDATDVGEAYRSMHAGFQDAANVRGVDSRPLGVPVVGFLNPGAKHDLRDFFASDYGFELEGIGGMPGNQVAGICEDANGSLAMWLADSGEEDVELVDYVSTPDNIAVGGGYPHTVCVVDGHVVDLTHRQIDEESDFPHVEREDSWRGRWRRLSSVPGKDLLEQSPS